MTKTIKMGNLYRQYLSIKEQIDDCISHTIEESSFIRGKAVETFERNFSHEIGTEHCVSCANGTDAIYIALKALNVKAGDEVIIPAMSWISTSETVTQAGGKVVFCDIDKNYNTIDPNKISDLITDKTVGIIPVHLYGQPAQMDEIAKISRANNLWIIEDCAQAHFAKIGDRNVGTFGHAATFSFYPGKNLGAMGDAGAILTNDIELSNYMQKFARHGGLTKGVHEIEGINSRLDGMQAAILNVKLQQIHGWDSRRRKIAQLYLDRLKNIDSIEAPVTRSDSDHAWHLFVIKTADRDQLSKFLRENGVDTSVNYPVPLPLLPCYQHLGHSEGDFPNAEKLSATGLSIPLYPELKDEEIERIIDLLYNWDSKK